MIFPKKFSEFKPGAPFKRYLKKLQCKSFPTCDMADRNKRYWSVWVASGGKICIYDPSDPDYNKHIELL